MLEGRLFRAANYCWCMLKKIEVRDHKCNIYGNNPTETWEKETTERRVFRARNLTINNSSYVQ